MWLLAVVLLIAILWSVSVVTTAQAQARVVTLTEAIRLAMENYPSVDNAASAIRSKELAEKKQQAAYGPNLSVSIRPITFAAKARGTEAAIADSLSIRGDWSTPQGLQISLANRLQSGGVEKAGLSVDASLRLWPSVQYSANHLAFLETKEAVVLVSWQEADARVAAAIDAYRRYRMLQIDQARLSIYAEESLAQAAIYDRTLDKAQQGLASQIEVLKAEEAKERSLAIYERAFRDYHRELKALLSDLALEEGLWQLQELPDSLVPAQFSMALEDAIAMALENDATIHDQHQKVTAARRKVEAAKVNSGLQVSLGGNARFLEEEGGRGSGFEAYVSFSYPLLDGGLKDLEVEEAKLALQQAEQALILQKDKVRLNVEKALSDLKWLEAQLKLAKANYERTQLEHGAKELQAANGLITKLDVEMSQCSLQQAHLDWLEAAVAHEVARLELEALIGKTLNVEGGIPIVISW